MTLSLAGEVKSRGLRPHENSRAADCFAGACHHYASAIALVAGRRFAPIRWFATTEQDGDLSSQLGDTQFRPHPVEAVTRHRTVGLAGPGRPVFHHLEPVGDLGAPACGLDRGARRFVSERRDGLIERVAIMLVQVIVDDAALLLL